MDSAAPSPAAEPSEQRRPRLLELVRQKILLKGNSPRTATTYIAWIRRYIFFHRKQHPADLGNEHVVRFLTHLVTERQVSAATQNQAFAALLFLYRDVLGIELAARLEFPRAKEPSRLPNVLSRGDVRRLLGELTGTRRLLASLLYGSGLRLNECLDLRVHNVDLDTFRIHVVHGKGGKSRYTLLPRCLHQPLEEHLRKLWALHKEDLLRGFGSATLPAAMARKSPSAATDFRWQYVFPGSRTFHDQGTGFRGRWHLDSTVVQRALRAAAERAQIRKRVGSHTLRHSFATHLLESGVSIVRVQKLLGHSNLKTTLVYLHVIEEKETKVASPLDGLEPEQDPR